MRLLALTLVVALFVTGTVAGSVSAQTAPQFNLGFKLLADLIPAIAGRPIENEKHDPSSGDALQRTTTGLMVWRKADNFTAFTDGGTTWVNGPFGVQSRPNNARFDWESAATSTTSPEVTVSLAFSRIQTGTWAGRGTVKNPSGSNLDVEINVLALKAPGGAPLFDAPTLLVKELGPGESRQIGVDVLIYSSVGAWKWQVGSHPSSSGDSLLKDVGTSRSLNLDPTLDGAVTSLRMVDGGEWLVRVGAESGVRLRVASTPPGVLGEFDPRSNLIIVSNDLFSESAWIRATVLSHELQHAASTAAGKVPTNTLQCLNFETEAFQRQSTIWRELWQGSLPGDVDPLHREFNDVAVTVVQDPRGFARQLALRYRSECGPLP